MNVVALAFGLGVAGFDVFGVVACYPRVVFWPRRRDYVR